MSNPAPSLPVMEGHGFYNKNSALQAAGVSKLDALWRDICRRVQAHDEPIVIVDYGCSEGRNSMKPISQAIDAIRVDAGYANDIEIIHCDLPNNDFNTLFQTLSNPSVSYLANRDRLYSYAVGRSYFDAIVPPGRVHLGWNTWTLQWMSAPTADAPDHVIAGLSRDPAIAAEVRQRQANDWKQFLTMRSRELRSGGRLLTAILARTERETGWEGLLDDLWASVTDLVADGYLTLDEAVRLTIPTSLRTIEDIRAPFDADGRYDGVRLEHCEIFQFDDPFWADFEADGDDAVLARRHSDFVRAWAGPALAARLPSDLDSSEFVAKIFENYRRRLRISARQLRPYMIAAVICKD